MEGIFESKSSVSSTLFIGLGGGGASAGRVIFDGLSRKPKEIWEKAMFIVFDTSAADDDTTYLLDKGKKAVKLVFPTDSKSYIENTFVKYPIENIDWFPDTKAGVYKPFFDAFFDEVGKKLSEGSQTRVFGKLAFRYNFNKIYEELQTAFRHFDQNENVQIFLFSGLGGGTGSGMFLEMLALLRHFLIANKISNGRIYLFATLGDILFNIVNLNDIGFIHANAYAAVKELYHFASDTSGYQITINDGTIMRKYPEEPAKLADLIFLFEEGNKVIKFGDRKEQSRALGEIILSMIMNKELLSMYWTTPPNPEDRKDVNGYTRIICSGGIHSIIFPKRDFSSFISSSVFSKAIVDFFGDSQINKPDEKIEKDLENLGTKLSTLTGKINQFDYYSSGETNAYQSILELIEYNSPEKNLKSLTKYLLKEDQCGGVKAAVEAFKNQIDVTSPALSSLNPGLENDQSLQTYLEAIISEFQNITLKAPERNGGIQFLRSIADRIVRMAQEAYTELDKKQAEEKLDNAKRNLDQYAQELGEDFTGFIDIPSKNRQSQVKLLLMNLLHYANALIRKKTVEKVDSVLDRFAEAFENVKYLIDDAKVLLEDAQNLSNRNLSEAIHLMRRPSKTRTFAFTEEIETISKQIYKSLNPEEDSSQKGGMIYDKKIGIINKINESISQYLLHPIVKKLYEECLGKRVVEVGEKRGQKELNEFRKAITELIKRSQLETEENLYNHYISALIGEENIKKSFDKWLQCLDEKSALLLEHNDDKKRTFDYYRYSKGWPEPIRKTIEGRMGVKAQDWAEDPLEEINLTKIRFETNIGPSTMRIKENFQHYAKRFDKRPLHIYPEHIVKKMTELKAGEGIFREPDKLFKIACELNIITKQKGISIEQEGEGKKSNYFYLDYGDSINDESKRFKKIVFVDGQKVLFSEEAAIKQINYDPELYSDIHKLVERKLDSLNNDDLIKVLVDTTNPIKPYKRNDIPSSLVTQFERKRNLGLPNEWKPKSIV